MNSVKSLMKLLSISPFSKYSFGLAFPFPFTNRWFSLGYEIHLDCLLEESAVFQAVKSVIVTW